MLTFIRGKLADKKTTTAIVDHGGIGFEVLIPVSTFERLGERGSDVELLTYLHVREDALILFGFATPEERDVFKDLLSVSGIGPKLALGIVSGSRIQEFYTYIAQGDEAALTRIPGLGKKTAQRLILDLKDKAAAKVSVQPAARVMTTKVPEDILSEATLAMMSLGYTKTEAEKAVMNIAQSMGSTTSVEELVRTALKAKK